VIDAERQENALYFLRVTAVELALLLVSGLFLYDELDELQTWTFRAVASLVLLIGCNLVHAYGYYLSYKGRNRQSLYVFWLQFSLIGCLFFTMTKLGVAGALSAFTIARASDFYGLRKGLYVIAGVVALYLLALLLRGWNAKDLLWIVFAVPFYLFVLALSHTFSRERRLRQRTDQLVDELQAAQVLLAQASRRGERLRIARDMHDLLGNHMTALILNLEVATHKNAGRQPHVEQALALARLLLGDLRAAVSDVRESATLDLHAAMRQLVANIPRLQVRLDLEDDLEIRDELVGEALLRCTQEALTNTLRHARARNCSIRLHRTDEGLILDVCDDGRLTGDVVPGSGLKGMQERVRALSGKLEWSTRDGAFVLRIVLPAESVMP
jgi:signal transduction histidine kinase